MRLNPYLNDDIYTTVHGVNRELKSLDDILNRYKSDPKFNKAIEVAITERYNMLSRIRQCGIDKLKKDNKS